jgi:hypothetical protein
MFDHAPWYALFDRKDDPRTREGARAIDPAHARELNRQGYGIFATANEFGGPRQIANLVRIHAWVVDMDQGEKRDQWKRIAKGPTPTMVNETKRGFHLLFQAMDATMNEWAEVQSRLIGFYDGDPNAKDVTRILRVPGFMHLKEPANPYRVETRHYDLDISYKTENMLKLFAEVYKPKRQIEKREPSRPDPNAPLWDRIYNLDCREALLRLSGEPCVNGETYDLRPVNNGKTNLLVDGKTTSVFLDSEGRIGSSDRGGPTLMQWLTWYGATKVQALATIKKYFPEIFQGLHKGSN